MTLPIERARSRRPITWLTIVGIVLLPAVIGGILVAALYNPVERLDNMSAAIVNEDEAVTINDQLVPLGRQLTAGLVEGSDELASNLNWVISNKDDAAEGLADGTYQAIVTIPENFSAAATSTAPGSTPEQATIEVTTPPDAKIVDDAITAQVTSAAASIMGQQLSAVYLENVLLGFTTLGDQLGDAATGATQLADGATDAASGAQQLADGATAAATGAQSLANGVPQLSSGATSLATGARDLSTGLSTISGKTREAATGASQLAAGVNAGADQLVAAGIVPAELTAAADGSAAATAGVAQGLGALVATCDTVTNPDFCAQLAAVQAGADGAAQAAGGTSYGLGQLATQAPQQIAGQLRTIGSNVATLSGGLGQLADGIDQSAAGAGALSSGATQLAGGVDQVGAGASSLATGITTLADGTGSLADGITTLADGTSTLADGLDEASTSIPSYTDGEAKSLATVVADPVAADGNDTNLFGASAVPLLATLALWFGGFGSFIALQAVPRRALTSRAPSGILALRTLAPAAGLGAVQGLLVAGVVQLAASYSWDLWAPFAFASVIAGIAFAAINQALVAAFGGAGRWFAGLVGVLALATGVVSTIPGVLASVAGLMPTTPAYSGMLAALTESAGFGAGIAGLLIWSVVAFIVTTIAVARRRVVQSRELLAISPIAA
ncbi:MAG: YhgE/Pip domain-containing protein [Rhodoglobus sp.]